MFIIKIFTVHLLDEISLFHDLIEINNRGFEPGVAVFGELVTNLKFLIERHSVTFLIESISSLI